MIFLFFRINKEKQMAVKRIFLSNRQEWLKARSGRIGGRDASAVIG